MMLWMPKINFVSLATGVVAGRALETVATEPFFSISLDGLSRRQSIKYISVQFV